MKKLLITFCILTMSFLAGNVQAKQEKVYSIKSAIVEYDFSGFGQKGVETLSFNDFGKNESRYMEISVKILGFKQTTKTLHLRNSDGEYGIDLNEGTGIKYNSEEIPKEVAQKMTGLGYSNKTIKDMGGVKKRKEQLLEKNCMVYELEDGAITVWLYKGVALKSVTNMGGMQMSYVATSIKENVNIPASTFEIPGGIRVEEESLENIEYNPGANMTKDDILKNLQESEDSEDENVKNIKKKAFGLLKSMF